MEGVEKGRVQFLNERTIRIIMILIAGALCIKYIFVDFGIDAEFQITMSYRLARGDIMFKEMLEPYQMSSFLCAFFIKIYLAIFRTTTGIVLYLQVIGVMLDVLVSYLIYRMVKKCLDRENVAFAMAWVFFLVSPKDVPLAEYANMQIWFSMLMCITMYIYYMTQKKIYIFLSGLCLCGTVLSYPSCLILFIGVLCILLHKRDKVGVIIFGLTCLLVGALYLCLIFAQVSFDDFVVSIKNMLLLETSHSIGVVEKCVAYLKDIIYISIVFCVAYSISYLTVFVLKHKKDIQDKERCKILIDAIFFTIVLLLSIYTVVFWKNYIRYSYSLTFLAIILIGTHYRKRLSPERFYFYMCGTIISLLQFASTLLLTNLAFMASVPYLLIAVIVAFLPISEGMKMVETAGLSKKIILIVTFSGALFLTFRNAYIIRPINGDVSSLLHIRGIVKEGPAIGIISEYMGTYMQNESQKEWKQYITQGDSIYLIGDPLDTLGYLYADTVIAAPTLVPTPGYNEGVLEYWKMNPDRYPDVIIASCWYGTLNEDVAEDSWIGKWIEQEYKPQYYVDGKYWRYYFK